ncbi:MAG: hypothetical protein HYZ75_03780 [Elusimicrobia bacterium]|nr:hypothetical protein [Elusimicrobiota bacterium]
MKTHVMLAALMALSLSPVLAEIPDQPEDPPKGEALRGRPDWKNKDEAKQGAQLAKEFGLAEKVVFELREKGHGWGDIRHGLEIARMADRPMSEVMALRDSGMDWGQIAQHYEFELGEARRERGDIRDAVGERRGQKSDGRAGRRFGERERLPDRR